MIVVDHDASPRLPSVSPRRWPRRAPRVACGQPAASGGKALLRMAKNILVISCDIAETRVALIENGIIAELHIERRRRAAPRRHGRRHLPRQGHPRPARACRPPSSTSGWSAPRSSTSRTYPARRLRGLPRRRHAKHARGASEDARRGARRGTAQRRASTPRPTPRSKERRRRGSRRAARRQPTADAAEAVADSRRRRAQDDRRATRRPPIERRDDDRRRRRRDGARPTARRGGGHRRRRARPTQRRRSRRRRRPRASDACRCRRRRDAPPGSRTRTAIAAAAAGARSDLDDLLDNPEPARLHRQRAGRADAARARAAARRARATAGGGDKWRGARPRARARAGPRAEAAEAAEAVEAAAAVAAEASTAAATTARARAATPAAHLEVDADPRGRQGGPGDHRPDLEGADRHEGRALHEPHLAARPLRRVPADGRARRHLASASAATRSARACARRSRR